MIPLRHAWCVAAAVLQAVVFAALPLAETRADDEPAPPDRREIWVPANELSTVLAREPRAVLLSREQYEKLLQDAGSKHAVISEPPLAAAVTSAKYTGAIQGAVMTVKGVLTVQVFSDAWASVPLSFGEAALGAVQADGAAAVAMPSPGDKKKTPMLLLHGRGEHSVTVEFSRPIGAGASGSHLSAELPAAGATSFELDLPPQTEATGGQPIRLETLPDRTHLTATLPADSRRLELAWRPMASTLGVTGKAAVQLELAYEIDAESVRTDASLVIATGLGALPAALELTVPAGATVLNVSGPELESWAAAPGRVTVRLLSGERSRTFVKIALAQPSLGGAAQATVALPVPALAGASRTEGNATVMAGAGVAIRELTPGAGAEPLPLGQNAAVAGKWSFDGLPAPAQVRLQKLVPRFSADLDTLVQLRADGVYLDRTITLHEEEGRLFALALAIPAGEELLDVEMPGKLPWRREGARVLLTWSGAALPGNAAPAIKVHTRAEPAGWSAVTAGDAQGPAAAPLVYPVPDLKIENVSHVTGYIAVQGPENLRLEAEASDTLERRDGRTTPVRGDYAWFRRDDFTLRVKVTRRPGEALATVTGYALPLAGVLDLHAQIAWEFRYAGARSVQVRVPEPLASAFNFESPLIASRSLNGDTWTLTFQKELTGENIIAVEAQIAITRSGDDQSHFQAGVPVIEPLNVQRTGGTWAVEANTDTEIELSQSGMNELDALLAPVVAGYQPRHRVIAVYSWLGPKYELSLTGTRHTPASVLHAVADLCELRSVVSTSGGVRTEATYHVRTAGLQFLEVTLPPASQLLSLLVDEAPVKPVEGKPGDVRVELPARRDPAEATTIRLLYETQAAKPWDSSGRALLPPPKLPPDVPVLTTKWRAYLPHGYYLSDWEGRFLPREPIQPKPLVLAPLALWRGYRAMNVAAVLASSGIADPRALGEVDDETHDLAERIMRRGVLWPHSGPDFEAAGEGVPTSRSAMAGDALAAPGETVDRWLADANGFFDTGRYDLANKRCEQILSADPSNFAARKLQAQINQKRREYAEQGYDHTRSHRLWQLESRWNQPVRGFKAPNAEQERAQAERNQILQRKLERIIIPKLEFREATIREGLEFLRQKSVSLDPEAAGGERGVQIELRVNDPALLDNRVTVSLNNIPLGEAIRYVTNLANLKTVREQGRLVVVPMSSDLTEPLSSKEWPTPPGFLQELGNRSLHESFTEAGVTFPPGAYAIFLQNKAKIVVKNSPENLDLVEAIFERFMSGDKAKYRQPTEPEPAPVGMTQKLQRKLETIIIPKLEFRDATIREAVDFLKQKSQTLDPVKEGVNIVLRLDASEPQRPPNSPPGPEEAKITVSLTNIPLGEALRYVTGLANLKYKVEQYAVAIVPLSMPTDVLATKEWKVPPGFLAGQPAAGAPDRKPMSGVDAKGYLTGAGITFPPGASAIFLPGSSRLIVKNSQENLDLVDAIVGQYMMSGPAPVIAPPAEQARRVGLLPMELEFPREGVELAFEGFGPADDLRFHYAESGPRARRLWLCFVFGGLAGLVLAGRRPWWRTAWVVVVLSAIPLCLFPSTMAICNLLLAGWLLAVIIRQVARRLIFAPPPVVRVPAAATLLLALLLAPAARAEEPAKTESETVIVPYDPKKSPAEQKPDRLYVPYERFEALWEAAKANRANTEQTPAPLEYALTSARYEGRAEERSLNFTAHFDLLTGQPWMTVPLPFKGAGISSLMLDQAPTALADDAVLVEKPGRHTLTVVFQIARAPGQMEFAWTIPRSAASAVALTLPQPELTATIEPAAGVVEQALAPGRLVMAAVGSATDLKVTLRTLEAATAARSQPATATIQQLVQLTAAGEEIEATMTFDLGAAALSQFTVYLDPTVELANLSAPNLQSWKLQPAGGRQALELTLSQPAKTTYELHLTTHRPAPALAREASVPALSAAAQRTVVTSTALLAAPHLEVTPLPAAGPRQIPNDAAPRPNWQAVATYAGNGALAYRVAAAPARREAHVDYLYQVGRRQVELFASFRFTRHGDDLYEVPLDLPPGFTVESVASQRPNEWWRDGDRLTVRFRDTEAVPEVVPLVVYLVHREAAAPEALDLRPIGLSGFRKSSGEAVLAAHKGVDLTLALTGQAAEVPPDKAAADYQVLPPLERKRGLTFSDGGFAAQVKLRAVPPRFMATWETHAEAHESWLALSTHVRLTVRQGSVDHAQFTLPASLPEARVTSPEVRETRSHVDADRRIYDLDFQNDVYDSTEFTVELEMPHTGEASVPAPLFPEALRASGYLVFENGSEGEMRLQNSGLDPATQAELPWISEHVRPTRLFRVASDAWQAKVTVERLEKAAGRVAFCAYADLSTALRADGTEWHRAVWHLQNRALQFLPVRLPQGAELMSVRVAGQSVRADAATIDGAPAILIPLIRTKPGELSYDVEAVYRILHPSLERDASRKFDDPDLLGITVERTFWHVWLPDGYRLRHTDGNLEPVLAQVTAADKLEDTVQELKKLSSWANSSDVDDATRAQARDNFRQLQKKSEALASSVEESTFNYWREGKKPTADGDAAIKGKAVETQNSYVSSVRSKANMELLKEAESFKKAEAKIAKDDRARNPAAVPNGPPSIAGANTFKVQPRSWSLNKSATVPLPEQNAQQFSQAQANGNRLFLNDNVVLNNTTDSNTLTINGGNLQVGTQLKQAPAQVIDQSSVALNTARGNIVANNANSYGGGTTVTTGTLSSATPSPASTARITHLDVGGLALPSTNQPQVTLRSGSAAQSFQNFPGAPPMLPPGGMGGAPAALPGLPPPPPAPVIPGLEVDNAKVAPNPPAISAITTSPARPAAAAAATPAPQQDADAMSRSDARKPQPQKATPAPDRRITLAVDFPTEGEAFHFRKLKAAAALELAVEAPAATHRLRNTALVAAAALFLLLLQRRVSTRAEQAA